MKASLSLCMMAELSLLSIWRQEQYANGRSKTFGTTVSEIVRMNRIANPNRIYPGNRLVLRVPAGTPVDACDTYTVVRGDTLSGIAARLGLDTDALAVRNGLFDPDVIYEGQVLRL